MLSRQYTVLINTCMQSPEVRCLRSPPVVRQNWSLSSVHPPYITMLTPVLGLGFPPFGCIHLPPRCTIGPHPLLPANVWSSCGPVPHDVVPPRYRTQSKLSPLWRFSQPHLPSSKLHVAHLLSSVSSHHQLSPQSSYRSQTLSAGTQVGPRQSWSSLLHRLVTAQSSNWKGGVRTSGDKIYNSSIKSSSKLN